MSLVPLMDHLLRGGDWWDCPRMPRSLVDQDFGMGLLDELPPRMPPTAPYWVRSRSQMNPPQISGSDRGVSEVINDKDKFQVNLDVSHFKPEEIKVKMEDRLLCIEGKHEEKMDEHGFVSRHFTRKYALPKDVDPNAVQSNLSAEGVLTIGAPKLQLEDKPTYERDVPITIGSAADPKAIQK